MQQQTLKYRPELDGLRAVAVIPVVLYHANLIGVDGYRFLGGGFLGVDVFFVISGYLICTIVRRRIDTGTFSLVDFYARRIQRLAPSLTVTVLLATVLGLAVFLPEDLVDLGRSLQWLSIGCSNLFFATEFDYFHPHADISPFLHTWSLSIEEQFYFVVPLLLVICRTEGRQLWAMYLIAIASFLFCITPMDLIDSEARFYILPTRAWELAAGALVGFATRRHGSGSGDALAWLGLGTIVGSYAGFTAEGPGLMNLVPVLGTCFFIQCAQTNRGPGRVLSWSPILYIGRISYTLYLLHWVLLTYGNYALFAYNRPWVRVGIVLASLAASVVVYHTVENPLRYRVVHRRRRVLVAFAGFSALTFTLGRVLQESEGLPSRFAEVGFVSQPWSYNSPVLTFDDLAEGAAAPLYEGGGGEAIVLAGDSHARMYANVFERVGMRLGVPTYLFARDGLDPFPGVGVVTVNSWRRILQEQEIGVVYFACRWDNNVEEAERIIPALEILKDSGIRAVIITQPPVHERYHVARTAAVATRFHGTIPLPNLETHRRNRIAIRELFRRLQQEYDLTLLNTEPYYSTDESTGILIDEGALLYRDQSHLTPAGAMRLETALIESCRERLAR